MVQKKSTDDPASEPLRLEQGDADVDEHRDRDRQQDSLDDGHTRSNAQIIPSITPTKATMPTTTRKSATDTANRLLRQRGVDARRFTVNKA
jgi:hypothetical protein